MNTEIKSLHYNLNDDAKKYLNKKIDRIHNAENMIVDLIITIKKEKDFEADVTVNFRWGVSIHITEKDFDLLVAIDKMMDKLEQKITKEKEKAKNKRQ
ncbi:MAG: ribosome-associated translation inhibitor RaiA [Treponema sp.]|nr:ribosome-associated translation inhibitor RaiA [Treponema sp.]MCL2139811.1 ribosome-associated translation inhibitor RaiA [Treponema sp.]MCL2139987.1 ribosome-associated translation inhibitor RaiA [Treponema sp.]